MSQVAENTPLSRDLLSPIVSESAELGLPSTSHRQTAPRPNKGQMGLMLFIRLAELTRILKKKIVLGIGQFFIRTQMEKPYQIVKNQHSKVACHLSLTWVYARNDSNFTSREGGWVMPQWGTVLAAQA